MWCCINNSTVKKPTKKSNMDSVMFKNYTYTYSTYSKPLKKFITSISVHWCHQAIKQSSPRYLTTKRKQSRRSLTSADCSLSQRIGWFECVTLRDLVIRSNFLQACRGGIKEHFTDTGNWKYNYRSHTRWFTLRRLQINNHKLCNNLPLRTKITYFVILTQYSHVWFKTFPSVCDKG